MKHKTDLPAFALEYLDEFPVHRTQRLVVLFHRWLAREAVELEMLSPQQIDRFVSAPAGKDVDRMTRNNYRWELRRYLAWLEVRGLTGPFNDKDLTAYRRRKIAAETQTFLDELATVRRVTTVKIYRTTLGRFHDWLDECGTALSHVNRDVCLRWAQHLHERGLHPATRVGMLVCVRRYLDWLFDRAIVASPGRALIFAGDLPKKPQYLPRPMGADADHALQERLKDDGDSVSLGLYVMRRTGLRIGELRRLERDCVRVDHQGQAALKVPLGKMNNERVVPLDEATLAAVTTLQERAREDGDWLLEGARGRPMGRESFDKTLKKFAIDLPQKLHVTPHQLRHTFATSLMNGGMSLPGIMKLLGHKDYRMTLRYTAIADETVGREYFEALSRVSERYELFRGERAAEANEDPVAAISDVIRWVTKHLRGDLFDRRAKLIIRRLESLREELDQLKSTAMQEN